MKNKAEIKKLQERITRGDFVFPGPNYGLNEVRVMLRDLIKAAIGYSESKTLEYDADTQTFGIEVVCRTGVGQYFGNFSTHLTIDPKKDLLKQMEDLVTEVEQIKTCCFAAEQAAEKYKTVQESLKPMR